MQEGTFAAFAAGADTLSETAFLTMCKNAALYDRNFSKEDAAKLFADAVSANTNGEVDLPVFNDVLLPTMASAKKSKVPGLVSVIEFAAPAAPKKPAPPAHAATGSASPNKPKPPPTTGTPAEAETAPAPPAEKKPAAPRKASTAAGAASLKDAFEAFASFGTSAQTEMDNAHFAKMCKECGLIGKAFTTTDADLIFNKTKAKGARKLTFAQFKAASLEEMGKKLKQSADEVAATVQSHSPQSSGTQAEGTRFHDDKSNYTGVYKAGGPTNVDRDKVGLDGVTDRNKASDARGAVIQPSPPRGADSKPRPKKG